MKAVTTPCVRDVFIVAEIFPYHTYEELASRVPAEFCGRVSRTTSFPPSLNCFGVPLATHPVEEALPKYVVSCVIPFIDVNLESSAPHIGAGMHESSE